MNMCGKMFSRYGIRRNRWVRGWKRNYQPGREAETHPGAQIEIVGERSRLRRSGRHSFLLHRLNARFPLAKVFLIVGIIVIIIFNVTGVTISRVSDQEPKLTRAPMQIHAKITERDPEGKMLVALTFDDGPSGETTPRLLDILKEKSVPATFFMLGMRAAAYPDVVRRVKAEGHEVASHTMYHQNLITLAPEAVAADIAEAKATMAGILGGEPGLIRPPYGNYDGMVAGLVGTPMILWSVDTLDWKNKDVGAIISTAMGQVHDGAVILMHDIYPTSVDSIPGLVDSLRASGYEFVTVSELAKMRHVPLVPGEAYRNFRP